VFFNFSSPWTLLDIERVRTLAATMPEAGGKEKRREPMFAARQIAWQGLSNAHAAN
jgi:2-hydroxychromene-2-carboxylate isomerase